MNVLTCKVPTEIRVGGVDPVELYLVFVNSHDGSLRFGVHATPIRVVCMNTLNASFKTAQQSWSCKHTPGATASISEARRTLNLTWLYAEAFQREMDALLDQEYTRRDFETLVRDLFPKPAGERAPFSKEQYGMLGLLESSPTIGDDIRTDEVRRVQRRYRVVGLADAVQRRRPIRRGEAHGSRPVWQGQDSSGQSVRLPGEVMTVHRINGCPLRLAKLTEDELWRLGEYIGRNLDQAEREMDLVNAEINPPSAQQII